MISYDYLVLVAVLEQMNLLNRFSGFGWLEVHIAYLDSGLDIDTLI